MIALLMGSAMGATANVEYCVKYGMHFERAKNPGDIYNFAVGWFWSNNAIDQNARKMFVEVSDYVSTQKVQLGSNGCVFVDVEGNPNLPTIVTTLKVLNEAQFNGVDVELRQEPGGGLWVNANDVSVTFTKVFVTDGSKYNFRVEATDGWQQMAVAGWMLERTNWRLEDEVERDCCLESGDMHDDGTCDYSGLPEPYTRDDPPYETSAPLIALGAIVNSGTCCGSSRPWDTIGVNETGLSAGVGLQDRFAISHELGHMFAGIRMGGPEGSEYPSDAPVDGCNGDRLRDDSGVLLFDKRGVFSKEFAAVSFREGWGNFVMSWAWDRSIQSAPGACELILLDFDIDGDSDNTYGTGHPYNECYKLGGAPELTTTGDPTAAWATNYGTNWLGAAMTNVGSCVETTECSSSQENGDMEMYNRTTISDVANMYWSLYNGQYNAQSVPAADLLGLYVDMCPRGWRENDGFGPSKCSMSSDLPTERARLSATQHTIDSLVDDALEDHLEH